MSEQTTPALLAYVKGTPVAPVPSRREAIQFAQVFRRYRLDGRTVPQAIKLARAEVFGREARAA